MKTLKCYVFMMMFIAIISCGKKNKNTQSGQATTETSTKFISTWKTDNTGTSNNDQITLPLLSSGTYSFQVDWGDGSTDTISAWNDAAVTHTYASTGTYTVTIDGSFTHFAFQGGGDAQKLIDISAWGNNAWSSMENTFYGCTNLNFTATDAPNLSNVTSFNGIFRGATSFNSNINNWDVRNVEFMNLAFFQASSFNQALNNWNTSSLTSLAGMFNSATSFNQDISSWSTSNVTNMNTIFASNTAFNQDISSWDTSQVTTMNSTFWGATAFNQDLSSWDVCEVTNSGNFSTGAPQWTLPKPNFAAVCP